jgi:beta-lactam-binding protein with PASTA domain
VYPEELFFGDMTMFRDIIRIGRTNLWAVPFLGFIAGYYISYFFFLRIDIDTPNLIGKTVQESLEILSLQRLSLRLMAEREVPNRPEGTILEQIPGPSQRVRPNQNVFVVVAKKRSQLYAPDFVTKSYKEVMDEGARFGVDIEPVHLKSNYPKHRAIAQIPEVGQKLSHRKMIIYFSSGNDSLYVMPQCKGRAVIEVEAFSRAFNCKVETVHAHAMPSDHDCRYCRIVDQIPEAGTIIDTSKPVTITLNLD